MSYFSGGIHLNNYYKYFTENLPIKNLRLPSKVVIPLSQHTGKPARPIVNIGDYVLTGQKIGESDGEISVPVHSSVSGKVTDICLWDHPVINQKVLSIIIESDGLDKSIEPEKKYSDYTKFSADELRSVIKESGIVGLGGAGFPTHVKLNPPKKVDTVIINGCECEPYLTCDDRLLQEYYSDIIEGAKIIMYILNINNCKIVIEDNKQSAIKKIQNIISNEQNIELKIVKTKYPQGAEKQLIKTVLNRTVPSGKLPFDVGVIVQNVATCFAINNAIKKGIPLIERVVTVTGEYIDNPGNYLMRIGTLASELLDKCGYKPGEKKHKLIFGGPMMGIAQSSTEIPIIKSTSGLLVLTVDKTQYNFYSCIRCGKCISACPIKLMPNMISIYAENEFWEKTKLYYPQDCIECGCCAYVCPAKRPLVHQIKLAKLNTRK